MEVLLNDGAQINWVNVDGNTPLYILVKNAAQMLAYHHSDVDTCNRYKDAVKVLLCYGPDVNLANKIGETPLLAAAWKGNVELIEWLLQSSARVNQANKQARSPLFAAAAGGHIDAVRVLLEAGANLEQADEDAKTPMDIAAMYGHRAVVALLEKAKEPRENSCSVAPYAYFSKLDKSPVNSICPNDSENSEDLSDNLVFHYNRSHSL